jgi:predicted PurR-regulated permease PerM
VQRREASALRIAALLATAGILWVGHPVGIGVLLGTLTAFTLLPLYLRLTKHLRRPGFAALICVGLTTLVSATAAAGLSYRLIGRSIYLVRSLLVLLEPGGAVRRFFEQVNARWPYLPVHPETIAKRVGAAASEISMRLASTASVVAGATMSVLLGLLFLLLTCFYVLQNWSALTAQAELLLPLKPSDTRALFDELRRVGRSVLLGTVLTSIAQGLLAGLGYYITQVPEAGFFAVLTAIASLVPGVGTLLVWVPAGIYLLASGHVALGIVELAYGAAVVVGFCDYILRPKLVGRDGELPALLTMVALFGGLEAFGLIGVILGPVIMSLSVAVLRIYQREATVRRAQELRLALPLSSPIGDSRLCPGPSP